MSETNAPLDPTEALRILDEESDRARRALTFPDSAMYLLWGVVYTLGYLPLALSRGDWAPLDLPLGLALGWFFALLAIGIIASIVVSERASRGIGGVSARQGARYGITWFVAFAGVGALSAFLGRNQLLDGDNGGIAINGISMVVVGVLFMAGGAIWDDRTQFSIGVAIALASAVGLAIGLPAYFWIQFAIGLALLGAGAVSGLREQQPTGPGAR